MLAMKIQDVSTCKQNTSFMIPLIQYELYQVFTVKWMILPLTGLGVTPLLVAGIPPAKTRNSHIQYRKHSIIPACMYPVYINIPVLLSQVSQQDWIKTSCPARPRSAFSFGHHARDYEVKKLEIDHFDM